MSKQFRESTSGCSILGLSKPSAGERFRPSLEFSPRKAGAAGKNPSYQTSSQKGSHPELSRRVNRRNVEAAGITEKSADAPRGGRIAVRPQPSSAVT